MKVSKESFTQIESAIQEALAPYKKSEQGIVTDIHLMISGDSGELTILDDDDQELGKVIIPEWVDNRDENFELGCQQVLTNKLQRMKEEKAFEDLDLVKPYSFILLNDDKETLADLLLIDDQNIILSDELLAGWESDLDSFLERLMEE
ncbi:MAG: hypothetical protein KBH23_01385 [Bacteroidaceae bacterium]|nr:hypothetical protein [Bacteroidaceae bacterium]MBP9636911.1 hypothetical protein [Bacteroidaceae bacterium]